MFNTPPLTKRPLLTSLLTLIATADWEMSSSRAISDCVRLGFSSSKEMIFLLLSSRMDKAARCYLFTSSMRNRPSLHYLRGFWFNVQFSIRLLIAFGDKQALWKAISRYLSKLLQGS